MGEEGQKENGDCQDSQCGTHTVTQCEPVTNSDNALCSKVRHSRMKLPASGDGSREGDHLSDPEQVTYPVTTAGQQVCVLRALCAATCADRLLLAAACLRLPNAGAVS